MSDTMVEKYDGFRELSKEEFVQSLIKANWNRKDAEEEYDRVVNGEDGVEDDCWL